jgi:hypothetical protein
VGIDLELPEKRPTNKFISLGRGILSEMSGCLSVIGSIVDD